VRVPLPITAFCLLSPNRGSADESSRAPLATLGREREEFQSWAAQLEDQKRDAERAFDRTEEATRLRRIKQRFDPLEQSRGTR
jgi:hypothetical protein